MLKKCRTLISLAGNFVNYFIKKTPEIFKLTIEHLWMTVLAVLLAIFIGVPVAILLTRHRKVASFIIGIASFIQTIPSLALLGFMIPVMGIGWGPAVVALFLYALLPIIRNTYTGIENVDPAITEAGRGMGLTSITDTLYAGIASGCSRDYGRYKNIYSNKCRCCHTLCPCGGRRSRPAHIQGNFYDKQ